MSRLDYCQYELVDDCYDWKNDHCDGCNIFKAYCEGARRAKNSIVRCKDCRWWNGNPETMHNNHLCRNWSKFGSIDTSADDFCSYGERREDGTISNT